MARINVESYAFDDPRFDALAGSVRCIRDRWHALGCCLRIWHLCANRRTDTIRSMELAYCLGLRRPLETETQALAVKVFVDVAGLGERCDDGRVRVRGTKGRTDYLDRMEDAKALPDLLVDYVTAHGPVKRQDLREAFGGTAKSTFYRVVNQLVHDSTLIDVNGEIALRTQAEEATPVPPSVPLGIPRESRDSRGNVPGQSRDAVLVPDPVPVLAPDPDLALAPDERANSARTRVGTDLVPRVSSTENLAGLPRDSHGTDSVEPNPGARYQVETRPDRYTALFEQWDRSGREACGDGWRSCGPVAGRHRVREALNHPELSQRLDADIAHGLRMLHAECAERQRLGHEDPWRWYRNAWKPRVLSMACEIPDEQAARSRVSPTSTRSTQKDWIDEVLDEMREENHDATRPRTPDDGRPDGGSVCCVPTA